MNHSGLQAGVARVDITPPAGVGLAGFLMRDGPSVGVHDRLYARALALDDGQARVVVIACDLLGLEAASVEQVRLAIEQATGVPGTNVLIAATHTHAAPATMFLRHCGSVDPDYMAALPGKLRDAARSALASTKPARVAAGIVAAPDVSYNRRDVAGPVDQELGLLRVDTVDGGPLAALLVYACHPVAAGPGNRLVSADYPGVLVDRLERSTGATVLFGNGACGDVNPFVMVEGRRELGRSLELVELVGCTLAGAAEAAWSGLTPSPSTRLRIVGRHLRLPLQAVPDSERLTALEAAYRAEMVRSAVEPLGERYRVAAAMLDWAEAMLEAQRTGDVYDHVEAEVQVIGLGDLALVGVPGELFAELGLAIKRSAAVPRALVLGYANGNLGYIPARAAYDLGGYEVDTAYRYYGYPGALAPEAGELIVAAALELIEAVGGC